MPRTEKNASAPAKAKALAPSQAYHQISFDLYSAGSSNTPLQAGIVGAGAAVDNGFRPSPYQQAIFEFCLDPLGGDGLVDAVPGSGKSTTLIELARRLPPDQSILMVAFNRHIASELGPKLEQAGLHYRHDPQTGTQLVEAKTIHSIGYATLKNFLLTGGTGAGPGRLPMDIHKYDKIIEAYILSLKMPNSVKTQKYVYPIAELLRFCQLTLTDPHDEQALLKLVRHYDLTGVMEFWETALKGLPQILEEGQRISQTERIINYDDMIYLPMALDLTPPRTYDWVLVDEYQDLNRAQLAFLLKLRAKGSGRFLFVGDYHQSIYGFTAADPDMKDVILARTSATVLPLHVCYRCPSSHVALAAEIYPQIEAAPNAKVGLVSEEEWDEAEVISQARTGDLIICRTMAPLIRMCFELIKQGKQATVRGRDIGRSMKAVLTPIEKKPGREFECNARNLWAYLQDWRNAQINLARKAKAPPTTLEMIEDKAEAVWAVYRAMTRGREQGREGEGAASGRAGAVLTVSELKKGIDQIFSDKKTTINLSTVHRAKGDEARRVFILRPDLMPHPMSKQAWEITQEWNCRYVALTRSKESLYLVKSPIGAGRSWRRWSGAEVGGRGKNPGSGAGAGSEGEVAQSTTLVAFSKLTN